MDENNSVDMGENSQDSEAEDVMESVEASADLDGDSSAPDTQTPENASPVEDTDLLEKASHSEPESSQPESEAELSAVAAAEDASEETVESVASSEEAGEPDTEEDGAPPVEMQQEEHAPEEAEESAAPPEALEEPDTEEETAPPVEMQQEEHAPEEAGQPAGLPQFAEPPAPSIISMAPVEQEEEQEPEPAVAEEEQEDDGRAWYVVHCYSGYENKVRHNLEQRIDSMGMKNLIFDVVVPTEEEIEVKEGKRRTVERRVFPGYILVNMIMHEESWYVVRNTPGVTSFVGMGEEPIPLRPEEVSQIIKRMEADAPRIKVTFRQGERVRIIDGPFNDFRGTVDEIDMERAKVRVMVNFFGRETPVELDFLQVEKS